MDDERFAGVLASAIEGAEEAFAELWRDGAPAVQRYLALLSPSMAEDLASETWLQVARDLRRFRGSYSDFRAWVFAVARNRATDHHRSRAGRGLEVPSSSVPDRPGAPDPADVTMETIATESALALIATLPADQAEVVLLRVVAGLDVKNVSAIVRKRPGTVRVLAHRGLRTLAERLGTEPL